MMLFFSGIRIKFLDAIIIILLMVLSFLPLFFLTQNSGEAKTVVINAHGKIVKTLSIDVDQTYRYNDGKEYNVIEVKDRAVRVVEANCYNQIDVKAGWIHKQGQSLVCLPHSLTVTILGDGPVKQDGKVVDYQ